MDKCSCLSIQYYNASCHLFDIAPLRGAVDRDIRLSIDIAPLRGGRNVRNISLKRSKFVTSNLGYYSKARDYVDIGNRRRQKPRQRREVRW